MAESGILLRQFSCQLNTPRDRVRCCEFESQAGLTFEPRNTRRIPPVLVCAFSCGSCLSWLPTNLCDSLRLSVQFLSHGDMPESELKTMIRNVSGKGNAETRRRKDAEKTQRGFESQAGLVIEPRKTRTTRKNRRGSRVRDMAEEWGQENGRVRHSFALILMPIEKTPGQCLWL